MADDTALKDGMVKKLVILALVVSLVALGWAIKVDLEVDNHAHSSTTSGAEPQQTGEGEGNLMRGIDLQPQQRQ
jgi:predicted metal-binding membrane protein